MKEKYIHFGLLAALAVVVLWILFRQKLAPAAVSSTPAASSPTYPNAPDIKLGDVSITSAPPYLTYNQPPDIEYGPQVNAEVGNGPNSCCDCGQAGQAVAFPTVPQQVYEAAVSNLKAYRGKLGVAA